MKNNQKDLNFQSAKTRAQFFIDNFQDMTYKEIAFIFGWAKKGDPESIRKSVQRVKNLKKSLGDKLNIDLNKRDDLSVIDSSEIIIPDSLKAKQSKIDPDSLSNSSGQGIPRKGFKRHTIIIREAHYESLKKLQKKEGKTIREIMDDILSSYFG